MTPRVMQNVTAGRRIGMPASTPETAQDASVAPVMRIGGSIIAIDPGNKESAVAAFDEDGALILSLKMPNAELLALILRRGTLQKGDLHYGLLAAKRLVIEGVACYGMAVGAEVFETVFWSGRFVQAWAQDWARVYRQDVKMHLCHSMRAKDGNIRQAIIDAYGGKEVAIGKKKTPGPLYGVSADQWAAIAVGITFLADVKFNLLRGDAR